MTLNPDPNTSEDLPNILIVDDHRANIKILRDLLQDQARIFFATDGMSALNQAETGDFDLILLDVMMPEMDGYEVCTRLKANPKTAPIPVIFVSALYEDEDETKGLQVGAVDYITKPFTGMIIRARVRSQLMARRYQRQLLKTYAELQAVQDRELEFARQIQMAMLPHTPAGDDRYTVAARLEPARTIGGDLYDHFLIDPQHLCIVIGDVSDKGIPAALFMVRTLTLLRTIAVSQVDPVLILTQLNQALCQDNATCMFVTLWCGVLHLSSGELCYASGGHEPVLWCRADGRCEWLDAETGAALGLDEEATFPLAQQRLEPGDRLVLYTDGVTEAHNTQQQPWGAEPLQAAAAHPSATDALALLARILDQVHGFVGCELPHDDLTMLVLHWHLQSS